MPVSFEDMGKPMRKFQELVGSRDYSPDAFKFASSVLDDVFGSHKEGTETPMLIEELLNEDSRMEDLVEKCSNEDKL